MFIAVRSTWGEERVFFFDEQGAQRSLPTGWTDVAPRDPFVVLAGGRSRLRVADLLVLVELLAGLRCPDRGEGL